jgi:hypothetical protein
VNGKSYKNDYDQYCIMPETERGKNGVVEDNKKESQ